MACPSSFWGGVVINHQSEAQGVAPSPALKRWSIFRRLAQIRVIRGQSRFVFDHARAPALAPRERARARARARLKTETKQG